MPQHRELNRWCAEGRLSDPELDFAELDEETHTGDYRRTAAGVSEIRLATQAVAGIPFLGDAYATKLARVRLLDVLRHEMAHQYQAEVLEVAVDHGRSFTRAAALFGANPSRYCTQWLWS